MKVCLFGPLFFRTRYGPEQGFINLAKKLADIGVEVHALVASEDGLESETVDNVIVHKHVVRRSKLKDVPMRVLRGYYPVQWGHRVYSAFLTLHRKYSFDVAHGFFATVSGFVKRPSQRPKVIAHARGSWKGYASELPWALDWVSIWDKIAGRLWGDLETKIYEKADFLLCNSNYTASWFPTVERKEVVYNGVNPQEFKRLKVKRPEKSVALLVGTFNLYKGFEYYLRAIPEIVKAIPEFEAWFIGDGPLLKKYRRIARKEKIEEHIKFFGYLPQPDLPKVYSMANIFVLPSLIEPFGIVNLEAMACELPVIATTVGGIPEIVEDEKTGFLVKPKNPGLLAEKSLELLESKRLRRKMGRTGRRKILEGFTWDKIARQIRGIYESML